MSTIFYDLVNLKNIFYLYVAINVLELTDCQRRIKGGGPVTTNQSYVAYLIKAPPSPQKYDNWICGGAIVAPFYIITSAACVADVRQLYAIVGYNRYVQADKLNEDGCTKELKKKVVLICTPKAYELDYQDIIKWSWVDIAVVRLESAINFNDEIYSKLCSYKPSAIDINYSPKYQEAGTDALIFGWGHQEVWRKPGDVSNYNQDILNYAPIELREKNLCKAAYKDIKKMDVLIEKYMICADGNGNINSSGELILKGKPTADGCDPVQKKLYGKLCKNFPVGQNQDRGVVLLDRRRSWWDDFQKNNNLRTNQTNSNETTESIESTSSRSTDSPNLQPGLDGSGICQNDHGGPLITWIGAKEVLIGVASVFRVDSNSKCTGPYLFTSTECNGAFLSCILNGNSSRRSSICDEPPKVKGFETIERKISWRNHPDGPAENELFEIRPQIPLHHWRL